MSDLFSTNAAKLKIMEKTLFEESPEMMISLGLFFRWLAAVEIQLDRNLCHAIGLRDFEAYEIISTSHSIPNKVKRLEDALKKHGSKTSPELHARLGYLNETVVTVRNKLAHGFIFPQAKSICVGTMGRMPDHEPNPGRPQRRSPVFYDFTTLRHHTLRLHAFHGDLDQIANETWVTPLPQTIGTIEFSSPLPQKRGDAQSRGGEPNSVAAL
ncbi:hypothetical protein [Ensifer adhaerens]|uniref:hypothetical protein n=1 Tax=Ensifer adhaerens TaxID=106592 RepID=UPI001319E2F8|nr:hypothetical protein [Ensifer adhaerens]